MICHIHPRFQVNQLRKSAKVHLQNLLQGNGNIINSLHACPAPMNFTILKQNNCRNVLHPATGSNVRMIVDINFQDSDMLFYTDLLPVSAPETSNGTEHTNRHKNQLKQVWPTSQYGKIVYSFLSARFNRKLPNKSPSKYPHRCTPQR